MNREFKFRGISVNPFDKWVFGSLLIINDDITGETTYYIQNHKNSRIKVLPDTVCRMVLECDGVEYYDKDIVEYDYEDYEKVRRIEPIIDTSLMVYVGRQCNAPASRILGHTELNVKVIGNTIENAELLHKKWEIIQTKDGWIRVEDKLPTDLINVIVHYDDGITGYTSRGYHSLEGWSVATYNGVIHPRVTH